MKRKGFGHMEATSCEKMQFLVEAEAEIFGEEAWSESMLTESLSHDYEHVFLLYNKKTEHKLSYLCLWDAKQDANKEEEWLGYVIFSNVVGDAELLRIAIVPTARKLGGGTFLMEQMLMKLRDANAERITLEVRAGNVAAKHLYEKFGMKTIFVRKGYYSHPTEDADIMQMEL